MHHASVLRTPPHVPTQGMLPIAVPIALPPAAERDTTAAQPFEPHLVEPLRCFLRLDETDPATVNARAQEHRLFAWGPTASDARCVNQAIAHSDLPARALIEAGMDRVFVARPPDTHGLAAPPRVLVVPLGLHAVNAVRLLALKTALQALADRFGPAALAQLQVVCVGGRALLPAERQPVRAVMAEGLAGYGSAGWGRLTDHEREALLDGYEAALRQGLGDPAGLQLPADAPAVLGESDSARHLWHHAPALQELREAIGERAHFIEAQPGDHPGRQRDNTHGNALLLLRLADAQMALRPGEDTVWVCSDSLFCPRATQIFRGYCGQRGVAVQACSVALTGAGAAEEAGALEALLPLALRETACMLNEAVRSAADGPANWFVLPPPPGHAPH
ncbi:hypothetical protein [Hydrogenophaga sp. T2]|uniref:hypothetical protein n=1 Tax=Hydrogenophaga sp. T2 TaxID=3132823 RepID=UPI003CF000B6